MRRRRLSRLVAGLLLVSGMPAMADTGSVPRADVYGVEIRQGATLPSGDLDLPATGLPAVSEHAPLVPTVQAIPTPTAFQAGLGVMIAVLVFRRVFRVYARSAGR